MLSKEVLKKSKKQGDKKRNKMELDAEQKRRERHKRFLAEIINHRKKVVDAAKNQKKSMERLMKDLVQYFENKERAEKQRREKLERERLRALKEDDEAAYFKLLEGAKHSRLIELLKQTDDCLKSLGAQLIMTQEEGEEEDEEGKKKQGTAEGTEGAEKPPQEAPAAAATASTSSEGESMFSQYMRNQKAYYTVAHKMEEKVEVQPTMLAGGQLKPYQLQGLQWMVSLYNNKLNGILADEMGLGKTIQTISLIAYLMEMKNNKGPHLVIVPLSTIENWRSEFERWAPGVKVVKYTGNANARREIERTELKERTFNVLLTQYEFITRDKKVLRKIAWNYIIIDEGHRIKNANCKLVQDLNQYKSKHRLLLTGTPLQNDLKELWALLHFLLPKIFDNVVNFETWFSAPFANSQDKAEMTEEETLLIIKRLHQVLRPFLLRREKHEVEGQLPEKVEKVIRCHLSAMQEHFYRQIQDEGRLLLDKAGGTKAKSLNNTMMQLRKVCNHPYLFIWDQDWERYGKWEEDIIRCSGKFELLDRMLPKLKATGHRVLIFSQMTQLLDIMEIYLNFRNHKFVRLDGAVGAQKRAEVVSDFYKDESIFVFLLSTRAGGLGLNLQNADTVIMFDSDWNPQQDLQAHARVHRIGQKKAVRVFTLLTTTPVEERIRERATAKRDAEGMAIRAGLFNQKSTATERDIMLTSLISKDSETYDDEVPTDDQLNQMMARSEEEIEIFAEIDAQREREEQQKWMERGFDEPPPRLMTEEELPEWMVKASETAAKEEEEAAKSYGRGRRERKEVIYSDLTDRQFDKLVEEGGDINEMLAKNRNRKKRSRKRARAEEEEEEEQQEDEDEEEQQDEDQDKEQGEEQDEEEQTPSRRTRGQSKSSQGKAARGRGGRAASTRPSSRTPSKKTADSEPATSSKKKKGKAVIKKPRLSHSKSGNDISDARVDYEAFEKIFAGLASLKSDDGRQILEEFIELPDKKENPDYYRIIRHPIALNQIKKKIENLEYASIEEYEKDVSLLCNNAQAYYKEGSHEWNDSIFLLNKFQLLRAKYFPPESESEASVPDSNARRSKRNRRGLSPMEIEEDEDDEEERNDDDEDNDNEDDDDQGAEEEDRED
eukprot:GEZU01019767.1.p1 GENE.GEZU01019767.1~~GEZU01019767.1.p1  ORF type:complete len:1306 (-),score=411.03 GEZU01019767.1:96-3443(-)